MYWTMNTKRVRRWLLKLLCEYYSINDRFIWRDGHIPNRANLQWLDNQWQNINWCNIYCQRESIHTWQCSSLESWPHSWSSVCRWPEPGSGSDWTLEQTTTNDSSVTNSDHNIYVFTNLRQWLYIHISVCSRTSNPDIQCLGSHNSFFYELFFVAMVLSWCL